MALRLVSYVIGNGKYAQQLGPVTWLLHVGVMVCTCIGEASMPTFSLSSLLSLREPFIFSCYDLLRLLLPS
jgi:hypothetical protein